MSLKRWLLCYILPWTGPCAFRPHRMGCLIRRDHLHKQKGEREWVCFKGALRQCRRRRCDHEEFYGDRIGIQCDLLKKEAAK